MVGVLQCHSTPNYRCLDGDYSLTSRQEEAPSEPRAKEALQEQCGVPQRQEAIPDKATLGTVSRSHPRPPGA